MIQYRCPYCRKTIDGVTLEMFAGGVIPPHSCCDSPRSADVGLEAVTAEEAVAAWYAPEGKPALDATETERLREAAEAPMRADAAEIIAAFERDRIPFEIALSIVGLVAGQLIDQFPAEERAEWTKHFVACFDDGKPALDDPV